MSDAPLAVPPAAEHRGWSLKMILWSAALAAVLLLAAWGAANWKVFHLAYCKHLIGSNDLEKRHRGIYMVLRTHVRPGMTCEQVNNLLSPINIETLHPTKYDLDTGGGYYYLFALRLRESAFGGVDVVLRFDDQGRITGCNSWGHVDRVEY